MAKVDSRGGFTRFARIASSKVPIINTRVAEPNHSICPAVRHIVSRRRSGASQ